MKKRMIVIIIVVVLALGGVFSLWLHERTAMSYAESTDKAWSACLMKDYGGAKDVWNGFLFYKGEKALPADLGITAVVDGNILYENKPFEAADSEDYSFEQQIIFHEKYHEFESFMTHYDSNKPKEVVLTISWTEDGESKKERLRLQ